MKENSSKEDKDITMTEVRPSLLAEFLQDNREEIGIKKEEEETKEVVKEEEMIKEVIKVRIFYKEWGLCGFNRR